MGSRPVPDPRSVHPFVYHFGTKEVQGNEGSERRLRERRHKPSPFGEDNERRRRQQARHKRPVRQEAEGQAQGEPLLRPRARQQAQGAREQGEQGKGGGDTRPLPREIQWLQLHAFPRAHQREGGHRRLLPPSI